MMSKRNSAGGFSLIELMVTVTIIGIIAGIAYPSYTSSILKGRRSDAEATLMDMAQREQQYLLDNRAYASTTTILNVTIPASISTYYTFDITTNAAGAAPSFTATATPIAGTQQASDYTLTIDNTGAKTPSTIW
jgi:type IV pilus assembly protein PilE